MLNWVCIAMIQSNGDQQTLEASVCAWRHCRRRMYLADIFYAYQGRKTCWTLTAFFFSALGGRRFFGLGPFSVSSSSDPSSPFGGLEWIPKESVSRFTHMPIKPKTSSPSKWYESFSTPFSTGAKWNQTVRPQLTVAAQGSAVCHTNKPWIYAKSADYVSHCWALLMHVR